MSDIIITKKAGEKLAVAMDFSADMGSTATISAITSVTSVVCNGGVGDLLLTEEEVAGQSVNFFVAGGTAGLRYEVRVTITTSEGETLIGDGILVVT